METELTKADKLLNDDGTLKSAGYAKAPLLTYNRECIKRKSRIREWDRYLITDGRMALELVVCNANYAAVLRATVVDLVNRKTCSRDAVTLFPKNKDFLSHSFEQGKTSFKAKKADFDFETKGGASVLKGTFEDFYSKDSEDRALEFEILISKPQDMVANATPFAKKHQFCLSQKVVGAACEGKFKLKGRTYIFKPETSRATIDQGRGVLPYGNIRYWANLQDVVDGQRLSLNLGQSTADTSHASENIAFLNGKASKVDGVKIYIRRTNHLHDYMGTWTFYSDDGRVELMFEPIYDCHKSINYLAVAYLPHQVFGTFTGTVKLEDGQTVELANVFGFAERVVCRW